MFLGTQKLIVEVSQLRKAMIADEIIRPLLPFILEESKITSTGGTSKTPDVELYIRKAIALKYKIISQIP
jgi:cephalosporin hydroxylase